MPHLLLVAMWILCRHFGGRIVVEDGDKRVLATSSSMSSSLYEIVEAEGAFHKYDSIDPGIVDPMQKGSGVTNRTPTGVQTCCEGRDKMTSPAGRLTTCLLHVGQTSDWHGCETRVE